MSSSSNQKPRNGEETYVDLKGQQWNLALLDPEEHAVVEQLRLRARRNLNWFDFDSYRMKEIMTLSNRRRMSGKEIIASPLFQIGIDLSGRLAMAQGYARPDDYRDDLQILITSQFKSQRTFCQATGLSETMLSHVLAGRKDLSIQTLTKALGKIGYGIRAVPLPTLPKNGKSRKAKAS